MWHISEIEKLQQLILEKRNRCIAIENRVTKIRGELAYMDDEGLLKASSELQELRKELVSHEMMIQKFRKTINEFYKNPIYVAEAC